ncbi:MAG: holo-ACP synthase [Bacillota bacterium]
MIWHIKASSRKRRLPVVKGIGTDLVEISRLARAVERHGEKFLQRVYTTQEQDHCFRRANPFPSLAARFAAKEAVAKALGTGIGKCRWTDIEVIGGDQIRPQIRLYGWAAQVARQAGVKQISLSLSHCKDYALAFTTMETGEENDACSYC